MHLSHLKSTVHPITGAVSHPTLWDTLETSAKNLPAQQRVAYVYQLISDLHQRTLRMESAEEPAKKAAAETTHTPDLINLTDRAIELKITPYTIVKWFSDHNLKVKKTRRSTDGKVQYLTTTTHWQTFLNKQF